MIKPNDEVRFSDYVIMGPLPEASDAFLAINTLKDSVALVGRETADAIRQGIRMNNPLYAKELKELAETNIIVQKQKNELYDLRYYITQALSPDKSSFSCEILPTMGCNLACPYCYAWRHEGEEMSEATVEKVIAWINKEIDSRKPRRMSMSFCGGEPTLHPSIVNAFVRDVSTHCKKADIPCETDITTNGVLLTAAFVREFMDSNATPGRVPIQITLDGPESMHNARRKARDGSNSFAAIMQNLHDLTNLEPDYTSRLSFNLRINVDRQNVDSLMDLAEQLQPIVATGMIRKVSTNPTYVGQVPHDQHVMSMQEWLAVVPPLWYTIADTYNMDFSHQRRMKPCMEFRESCVVIGSDGSFYTCQGFGGNPDLAVGHIDTGVDIDAYVEHFGLMPWEECIGKCPLVTWCWGWCRGNVFNIAGDWRARVCHREALIEDGLAYYRFIHRHDITKWLHNRANDLEDDDESYFKEVSVSRV